MASSEELTEKIEQLASTLAEQPKEVTEALLRVLQEQLGKSRPTIEQLTGLIVTTTGRAGIQIIETNGQKHTLAPGETRSVVPVPLGEARSRIPRPEETASLAPQPFPSSVLLVVVRTTDKAATFQIDASPLYRNWARWGPMQLVVRIPEESAGTFVFDVVGNDPVELEVAQGHAIEIVGVGYAPRIDPGAIFAGHRVPRFSAERGKS